MKARIVIPENFGAENLEKLKARMQQIEREPLRVQVCYDNSLLGGFVVFMHGYVYDASIRDRLEQVRQKLAAPTATDGEKAVVE